MVEVTAVVTVVLAAGASLFMAWSIGAGSSGSTPFAPAVGANAVSVLRAAFVVGLLGLAGATLQGANVTEAVGRELTRGAVISPAAATIGLLIAGGLVAYGVRIGYPIATAFTVTGAMIGVGLALGGDPAWPKYREIVALWVATPIVGGGVAYAIARLLLGERAPERHVVPALGGLVGVVVANIELAPPGTAGRGTSLAAAAGAALPVPAVEGVDLGAVLVSGVVLVAVAAVVRWDVDRDLRAAQRRFLLALGGLVAFSAGGSQVGLAIGPLLPMLGDLPVEVPLVAVLFAGGLGLLAGSWTGAPRMIKALSQDYASLGPSRSIAALVPAFGIAQTAVLFGIPVSFNEIIVSAIVGSGYAAGAAGVSREKMLRTVAAWVGSLVLALAGSYAAVAAVRALA